MHSSTPMTICIGETMAMLASSDASPLAASRTLSMSLYGAESNLAQHLREGGYRSLWISRLGQDPFGTRILRTLAEREVDTSYATTTPAANTGLCVKDHGPRGSRLYDYRRGSAASLLSPGDAAAWPLEDAALVHTSGVTLALSESCRALVFEVMSRVARSRHTFMCFDVNYREALWTVQEAAEIMLRAANRADVVFVGLDEASVLWGADTAEKAAALFPRVRYVVVEDGAREAVEFARIGQGIGATDADGGMDATGMDGGMDATGMDGGTGMGDGSAAGRAGEPGASPTVGPAGGPGANSGSVPPGSEIAQVVTRVPSRKVEVVDPVGAGEAFAGGYLSGLLRGRPPRERLELGHSMAEWVLECPEDYRPGHGPDIRPRSLTRPKPQP